MQQDNKIEDKLRQMNNKQLPDLSHMDKHWQQMQAMLNVPLNVPQKPTHFTTTRWFISGAAIVSIIILSYYFIIARHTVIERPNSSITIVDKKTDQHTMPNNVTQTSPKNKITNNAINLKKKNALILIHSKEKIDTTNLKINFTDCSNCSPKHDSVKGGDNKQILLNAFVSQFEKKAQQFIINTNRDTVINCNEGTNIFIAANSFNTTGEIIFSVKEFYKYSDMVLNKLITKSDDEQLISGGMLHLTAYKNGTEVFLNPNHPIRVYIPNISSKDSMSVFNGEDYNANANSTDSENSNFINWRLNTIRIDSPVYKMFIRAIDLRDNLVTVNSSWGRSKAIFTRSRESTLGKEDLQKILEKKYHPEYDKIRVRKQWERNLFFKKKADGFDEEYGDLVENSWGVGDTAELTPVSIKIYKLQPIDTTYKIVYSIYKGTLHSKIPELANNTIAKIGEKYSIQLDKLGWINCDRFWKNKRRKINYAVDLKDSAVNYYTMMVFNSYKSIMNGYCSNATTVTFPNIPVNEPVKIISFGIDKNGKSVSSIKEITTSAFAKTELEFEPTSATILKNSLSKIDK